jgi:hypothetical protein
MQIREKIRTSGVKLFPDTVQPPGDSAAADNLQAQLIEAFETTLQQGMQPTEALAVILAWASSEIMRFHPEQSGSLR